MSFQSPLRVEILDELREDRVCVRLLETFAYQVRDGDVIVVPAGFVTDFASIPRMFWRLEPPLGRAGKAAVVHDFLYREKLRTREEADTIFRQAMGELGVPMWKRRLMWAAVRVGGAGGWGT